MHLRASAIDGPQIGGDNRSTGADRREARSGGARRRDEEGSTTMAKTTITHEFYEAFQRAEFDRWDAVIAEDLLLNLPVAFGIRGLKTFKEFAVQFTNLGYRIDLVDEHLALDADGNGRGFITFCLHWKHMKDFGALSPTGREGTSVETALFTIRAG